MQTSDTNNQLIPIGYCVNEFTVSATLLMLAQNGSLMTVTQMIQERARIAADLEKTEQKLLSCNNPLALARYARWCETRKKNFSTALKQLAEMLETKKRELTVTLQQIDEQMAQQNLSFEWTIKTACVSLIPVGARPLDASVALRNTIIDQNLERSSLDICRLLDSYWHDGESPPGFLPENWQEKHGSLVHKMISSRRQGGP